MVNTSIQTWSKVYWTYLNTLHDMSSSYNLSFNVLFVDPVDKSSLSFYK